MGSTWARLPNTVIYNIYYILFSQFPGVSLSPKICTRKYMHQKQSKLKFDKFTIIYENV